MLTNAQVVVLPLAVVCVQAELLSIKSFVTDAEGHLAHYVWHRCQKCLTTSRFNTSLAAGHRPSVKHRQDRTASKEKERKCIFFFFPSPQFESQANALSIFDIPYAARTFNYTLISFRAFSPRCHPAPSSGIRVLGESWRRSSLSSHTRLSFWLNLAGKVGRWNVIRQRLQRRILQRGQLGN